MTDKNKVTQDSKPKTKICEECGKEYPPNRSWQRFCHPDCRMANWKRQHPYITPEDLKEIKEKLGIKIK